MQSRVAFRPLRWPSWSSTGDWSSMDLAGLSLDARLGKPLRNGDLSLVALESHPCSRYKRLAVRAKGYKLITSVDGFANEP